MHASFRTYLTAVVLLALTACGDSTGPGSIDIRGPWAGTADLGNAFSARADYEQSGNGVSGTMRVTAAIPEGPVTGQINQSQRTLEWTAFRGCAVWSGTLVIDAPETEMAGTILGDRSGCVPQESNVSGTLRLTR